MRRKIPQNLDKIVGGGGRDGSCVSKSIHIDMTRLFQGFGLTALEAISAGVPVLVSKYSGLARALREVDSGDACIVEGETRKEGDKGEDKGDDKGDEKADSYKVWASRIKKLRDLDRKVRMEQACTLRENFGKKYSWDKEGQNLSKMLLNMLPFRGKLQAFFFQYKLHLLDYKKKCEELSKNKHKNVYILIGPEQCRNWKS